MQRDSLSTLFFCTVLVAITHELNRADCGYQVHKTERKINRLLYVSDLKLLLRDEKELENKIKIMKEIGIKH